MIGRGLISDRELFDLVSGSRDEPRDVKERTYNFDYINRLHTKFDRQRNADVAVSEANVLSQE